MLADTTSAARSPTAVSTGPQWTGLLLGLFAVYALFHWSAATLGSDRGQAGLLVGVLVVSATLAVECRWSGASLSSAMRTIGLGAPRPRGLVAATFVCGLLLLVPAVFARATASTVTIENASPWLIAGLFAQGGIAEETLFRGYLFGHLRIGRTFWRAAVISMMPFAAVHLMLFVTLPFPVALAALLLAVVMSFPMAHLFELGGATIWPSALPHFVVQGTVKIVVFGGDASPAFPLVWMLASAILPLLVFVFSRPMR